MEEEWKISTNGSNVSQSAWSYSDLSHTTEPWMEDEFMESIQDSPFRQMNPLGDIALNMRLTDSVAEGAFSSLFPSHDTMPANPVSPSLDHGRSYSAFEDQMWASGSDPPEECRRLSASPHHSGTLPTSNEPWDPLGHPRVMQYDSGFVAFVDSPKSSSDQSSCEVSPGPDDSPQETVETATHASHNVEPESHFSELPAVRNQQQLRWEHISVGTYDPSARNTSGRGDIGRRRRKGRYGPLDTDKAKDARIMRKLGVCWPCRVSKVKCSPGSPCGACQDHHLSVSPLLYQVCCRSGIANFDVLYFPAVLISHFNKEEVKSLVARNVERFIGPAKTVKVHCGRSFTPMELTVHFFRHKTDALLNRHHFTGPGKERTLKLIIQRCAPVGMLGVDIDALKKECMSYIKSMVSHPAYARQVAAGDASGIHHQVLEVIHKYCKLEKNGLLDLAMQLHAMHFFMARILTFTKDSASMVNRVSRNDLGLDLPSDVISSRLLNRQLKHAMHILHRRQTKTVLQEFERHLRKREQGGWPISFCVVAILCLCMEDIQIAANNFVFTDTEISQGLRGESYKACWQLEDKPYRQCTQLFHDMYRSYKRTVGHQTERGFNPILQDGYHQTNWNQATQEMLYAIRKIINDSEAAMRALSKVSVFDGQDQPEHHILLDDHSARLLSKFLLSFLEEP